MDLFRLKLLFLVVVSMNVLCTAGVNSLELNAINLSTLSSLSSVSQLVNITTSPKATNDENIVVTVAPTPTNNSPTNLHQSQSQSQSIEKKLLSDAKDTASSHLEPNAANLSEARITSITFRSEDGDVDTSSIDRDNAETISFGIRSFTVEVAPPVTEKPIPLDDIVCSLQHTASQNKQNINAQVLNEQQNEKVRDTADALVPITRHQANRVKNIEFEQRQQQQANARANRNGNANAQNLLNSLDMPILPIKLTSNTKPIFMNTDAFATNNNGNNNEHEQLSISSNGMRVEQKLENGLYRIKIAEIITDEFNNGLGGVDDVNEQHKIDEIENSIKRYPNPTHSSSQINIADLFPSKMEDFVSIIRDSNEKIINEKNRLVGLEEKEFDDANRFINIDDRNEQENVIQSSNENKMDFDQEKQTKRINSALLDSNFNSKPIAKSEIQSIDKPDRMKNAKTTDVTDKEIHINLPKQTNENDKITDFTSKMQVNDEMISNIEQSFRESSNAQQSMTPPAIMLSKPIDFIERRVKKFDSSLRKRFMQTNQKQTTTESSIMNKLASDDSIGENTISPLMDEKHKENIKYTSVKLSSKSKESMLDNVQSTKKSYEKANSTQYLKLEKNNNDRVNETTSNGTNLLKKNVIATTLKPINANERKILFIDVNNNGSNATTSENDEKRLQQEQQQIIEESKRNASDTTNGSKMIEPLQSMHLFIYRNGSGIDQKLYQTNKTNYNDSGKELLLTQKAIPVSTTAASSSEDTTILTTQVNVELNTFTVTPNTTSNDFTKVDAISSTKSNLQQHTSSNTVKSITDKPITKTTEDESTTINSIRSKSHSMDNYDNSLKQKSYGRCCYDGFLFEIECDMQTQMPAGSTLWRGNETHELNLPTTVSHLTISFSFFSLFLVEATLISTPSISLFSGTCF